MPWIVTLLAVFGAGIVAGYMLAGRRDKGRGLPARTPQELHDALTHIAYEFVGLERATAAFQGGQRRFDLEGALVHARNLTDFFWAPSRRRRTHRDGVYAAHYFSPGASWAAIRNGLPQLPNQRYDAISGQLAHISLVRSRNGARDFAAESAQIAVELRTVWERWRTELRHTHWTAQLDAELAYWRAQP